MGWVTPELVGLHWKALTWGATRRIRFAGYVAGWLSFMVLHGRLFDVILWLPTRVLSHILGLGEIIPGGARNLCLAYRNFFEHISGKW